MPKDQPQPKDQQRRRLAQEAARLIRDHHDYDYFEAKRRAERRLAASPRRGSFGPTRREIQQSLLGLAEADGRGERDVRYSKAWHDILAVMRLLEPFRPSLVQPSSITSADGRPIPISICCDTPQVAISSLRSAGRDCRISRKRRDGRLGEAHIRVAGTYRYIIHLAADTAAANHRPPADQRAWLGVTEVEEIVGRLPDEPLDGAPMAPAAIVTDRFRLYETLLTPLEQVRESRRRHPEGDALYHSLQVFDLAKNEYPFDEEVLLAALLHDVGKAIDPQDHTAAGLQALAESITPRCAWLIEHQADAQAWIDGTLGMRSRRRLAASPDLAELLAIARYDRAGRVQGVATPDVHEALDYIRRLAEECGD